MIVCDDGDALLLITQPDHAWLSGQMAAAIRSEAGLRGPDRDALLIAAREHDNGWIEVDAAASVDPQTGRPYDFVAGPARVKQELWPRGITRVAAMHLRAGALVAEHALTVYGYRAREAEWESFFAAITAHRNDLLRQLEIDAGAARDAFERDYRCVRLTDVWSLQFCNRWTDAQEILGYRSRLQGSTLVITPDPFGGAVVPLRVMARRIPARLYAHDGDLRVTLANVIPEFLDGEARGIPM